MASKKITALNLGGRPPKIVEDEATLEKLSLIASAQHTQPEAASLMGVSLSCFEGFLRDNKKAREVWDAGRESGRASLRRMQFKSAQGGNTTMQIWLGKQYLGQKDKHEVGGDAENPLFPTKIEIKLV